MGVFIGIYRKKQGAVTDSCRFLKYPPLLGRKRPVVNLKTVPEWLDPKVKIRGHKVSLK